MGFKEERLKQAIKFFKKISEFVENHPSRNSLYCRDHGHSLTFCDDKDNQDEICCSGCKLPLNGPLYGCIKCQLFVHQECMGVPLQEINQLFFHEHQLDLCQDLNQSPPFTISQDMSEKNCRICSYPVWGTTAYGCVSCKVLFHKFCLELPLEIRHGLHQWHGPIALSHNSAKDSWEYKCTMRWCPFRLNPFSFIFSISYQPVEPYYDGHILTFYESYPVGGAYCISCGEAMVKGLPALLCEVCNFSLHFQCVGALPNVKSIHVHDLKFSKSYKEDDSGEYYCDVCEEKRDPDLPVYHCTECNSKYVAHYTCALAKGGFSLAHRLHGAELDTRAFIIFNRPLVTNCFLHLISKDEMKSVQEAVSQRVGAGQKLFSKQEDISLFLNENFREFISRYESMIIEPKMEMLSSLKSAEELVKISKFLIPKKFAPVLKALLDNYGNFVIASTLNPAGMLKFLPVLCAVMHRMCNFNHKITWEEVFHWWDIIRIAESLGFDVHFAFNKLKKTVSALFEFEATISPENLLYREDEVIKIPSTLEESELDLASIKVDMLGSWNCPGERLVIRDQEKFQNSWVKCSNETLNELCLLTSKEIKGATDGEDPGTSEHQVSEVSTSHTLHEEVARLDEEIAKLHMGIEALQTEVKRRKVSQGELEQRRKIVLEAMETRTSIKR